MPPVRKHTRGSQAESEPPSRLVTLADTISDPSIIQSGLTTTADGQWALYVTVPAEAVVPIPSVEKHADGYPVVYEAQPEELPIAAPAYPRRERTLKGRKGSSGKG